MKGYTLSFAAPELLFAIFMENEEFSFDAKKYDIYSFGLIIAKLLCNYKKSKLYEEYFTLI
jgi:hypothetical protein